MRAAAWRWKLVPMVALVAGCLPSLTQALPASFTDDLRGGGWTFTVASPGPDAMAAEAVVADLRHRTIYGAFLGSRAIPVFGVLGCALDSCQGPDPPWGDEPGTVWLVLYPDSAVAGGDIGWALVDGVAGYAQNRYVMHRADPRP